MKSSSNKGPAAQNKLGGGYALPGDEEDEENGALIGQVNIDDDPEENKAQDSEEDPELDQEEEEDADQEGNPEDEDIDQQIVNIQSKNGRENL